MGGVPNTRGPRLIRIALTALLLLSLTQACGELTPYAPLGFHGGYSSSHLGGATYRIYAKGTFHSDYDVIKSYFHRRAAEVCLRHRTSNYEVVDLNERPGTWYGVKPEIVGTIECVEPEGVGTAGRRLESGSQLDSYFSLLANQLMQGILGDRSFRLAVLPFKSAQGDKAGQLGAYCSNKLTAVLFGFKNVQLVERLQLDRAVDELELTLSGRFDETTIKSVGKFLGVDAIVVGSYTVPERVGADINARVIEVATGKVLGVGSVRIPRVWIEGLLSS